jgi:hypothetical protein
VAAAVGKHLLAALLAKAVEALAAQLLQLVALGVAQFVAADQAVGAVAVGGDAIAGENLAHHPFHAFGVVVDLGHVFAQDPPGHVLRWGGAGCCLANQWPSSSISMRGWSMGLMRMRLEIYCRRRRKAAEGLEAME